MQKRLIIFPVHTERHWVIMCINVPNRTMTIYDSLLSHAINAHPAIYGVCFLHNFLVLLKSHFWFVEHTKVVQSFVQLLQGSHGVVEHEDF